MTDNTRIWCQVEKTDPTHTKHVNQRGGFTAVSANYQIMRATEVFGPIGEGWGYDAGAPIFQDTLMIVPVTMWHSGDRTRVFGPMYGCEEWKDKNGRVDSDAPKKATTDAITKLLSQLGFNADVFLGKFDDNKYVAQLKREFAGADKPALGPVIDDPQWAELTTLISQTGVDITAVCDNYGIDDLKQLPADKFNGLRQNLIGRLPKPKAVA